MSSTVTDSDLIAYYHGRLPGDKATIIDRLLESDSEAASRFQGMVGEIESLVAALRPADRMPAGGQIETMIRTARADTLTLNPHAGRSAPKRQVIWQAIAASMLLAIGLAGGFGLSEWRNANDAGLLSIVEQDLVVARSQSRQDALEQVASGESYKITDDERDWLVEVTPVRTYQNANGAFCREFIEVWELGGTANGELRIACRDGTGRLAHRRHAADLLSSRMMAEVSAGTPTSTGHAGAVIDMRDKGIGDVVVACWLAHSARAVGLPLRINPRGLDTICKLLDVSPPVLTDAEASNWAKTDGIGHRHEYGRAARGAPLPRFAAWAESLGMAGLAPVRPPYVETPSDGAWAEEAWRESAEPGQLRVAMFPEAAWLIRRWPSAYFIDLASMLKAKGAAVVVAGANKQNLIEMGSRWFAGFPLNRTAALMAHADVVIGNDSGPAHLAGCLGVQTFVVAGPTDGSLVFDHDPNIRWIGLPPGRLNCHPCHFAVEHGYRDACKVGGCQALMTLTPEPMFEWLWPLVALHSQGS